VYGLYEILKRKTESMKKHSFSILLSTVLVATSFAQSSSDVLATAQTTESTIKIDKTDRPAIAAEYNIPADALKDELKEVFKSKGIKLEKSKGLLVAKAVSIQEMDNTCDLYFDVDSKSRSEKSKSVIKMAMSSGYDNFISPASTSVYLLAKKYIASSLTPAIYAEKKQVDISAQTESISKAQKIYTDLLKENEKLEKQQKSLENDIAENKRKQELQLKEVEKQKTLLEDLKSAGNK
jgi:hypothetical protein